MPIFNALLAFALLPRPARHGAAAGRRRGGFVGVALLVGRSRRRRSSARSRSSGWRLLRDRRVAHAPYLAETRAARRSRSAHLRSPRSRSRRSASLQAPATMPGWKTIASVAVLGIIGTAVAYLLFFTIIAGAGAAYAALVTYLVPPVALAYGAIFLDESVGARGTRRPRADLRRRRRSERAHARGRSRRHRRHASRGRLIRAVISLRRATADDVDWLLEL